MSYFIDSFFVPVRLKTLEKNSVELETFRKFQFKVTWNWYVNDSKLYELCDSFCKPVSFPVHGLQSWIFQSYFMIKLIFQNENYCKMYELMGISRSTYSRSPNFPFRRWKWRSFQFLRQYLNKPRISKFHLEMFLQLQITNLNQYKLCMVIAKKPWKACRHYSVWNGTFPLLKPVEAKFFSTMP